jgi:hypothetical protein
VVGKLGFRLAFAPAKGTLKIDDKGFIPPNIGLKGWKAEKLP